MRISLKSAVGEVKRLKETQREVRSSVLAARNDRAVNALAAYNALANNLRGRGFEPGTFTSFVRDGQCPDRFRDHNDYEYWGGKDGEDRASSFLGDRIKWGREKEKTVLVWTLQHLVEIWDYPPIHNLPQIGFAPPEVWDRYRCLCAENSAMWEAKLEEIYAQHRYPKTLDEFTQIVTEAKRCWKPQLFSDGMYILS